LEAPKYKEESSSKVGAGRTGLGIGIFAINYVLNSSVSGFD